MFLLYLPSRALCLITQAYFGAMTPYHANLLLCYALFKSIEEVIFTEKCLQTHTMTQIIRLQLLTLFCFLGVAQSYIYAQQSLLTLKGHNAKVYSVVYSPNGKYLASGGADRTLKLWDAATGKFLHSFAGHRGSVLAVKFSPDNKNIATASVDGTIKIWGTASGVLVKTLEGHADMVGTIDYSPDGKWLVSGSRDKTVKLWDVNSGHVLHTFNHQPRLIYGVCFDPKGKRIVSTSDVNLSVWNATNYQLEKTLKGHKDHVMAVSFTADGSHLVSGSRDGSLKMWDLASGRVVKEYTEPYALVTSLAISPNGFYLVRGGKNVKLWDAKNAQKVTSLRGHFKNVNSVAFSPNGQMIASASDDQTVKVWRTIAYTHLVKLYIEPRINQWQKKGKFEKSDDYLARVNESTRREKIYEYTQQAVNKIGREHIDWASGKNEYDADNESFKITFKDFRPIYVHVPLAEAKKFDQNFKNLKYKNATFTLANAYELAILHVDISNPTNGKTYAYDSQNYVAYTSSKLKFNFDPISINTNGRNSEVGNADFVGGFSDVDVKLPKTQMKNPDAIAVVIGNTNYEKTKRVKYAINDARSIKNYLVQVLGYKPGNVFLINDATLADFKTFFGNEHNHKGKLYNSIKANESDVFVYYSGHGAPSLKNNAAYFVPVEADPQYVELSGYHTDIFYRNLAKLPAKSVTVVLDACFSGATVFDNISPIVVKSKGIKGIKNGVLLSSSSKDQVSCWYNKKVHGMFTYFFLKAIHNKNADKNKDNQLTYEEIYKYLVDNNEGVPYFARRIHGIEQVPRIQGKDFKKVFVKY